MGKEDVQEMEMTGPVTQPGAGVTRGEDGRIYRMLRFHTWVEADGEAPC